LGYKKTSQIWRILSTFDYSSISTERIDNIKIRTTFDQLQPLPHWTTKLLSFGPKRKFMIARVRPLKWTSLGDYISAIMAAPPQIFSCPTTPFLYFQSDVCDARQPHVGLCPYS